MEAAVAEVATWAVSAVARMAVRSSQDDSRGDSKQAGRMLSGTILVPKEAPAWFGGVWSCFGNRPAAVTEEASSISFKLFF